MVRQRVVEYWRKSSTILGSWHRVRYEGAGGFAVIVPADRNALALRRHFVDFGTLLVLCAVVGVIAGFGAAGFHYLLGYSKHLFLDRMAG